jgi:hypothetical protein
MCLGSSQALLHPGTRGDKKKCQGSEGSQDCHARCQEQMPLESKPGKKPVHAHPKWSTKLPALYHRVRNYVAFRNRRTEQQSKHTFQPAPRSYHDILQPEIPPSVRFVLLTLYDTVLILVLTLHVYRFVNLIAPRKDFCYTHDNAKYPYWKPRRTNLILSGARQLSNDLGAQCRWYNPSITAAGGCASAVAALLAATHAAAMACRLLEPCYIWIIATQLKRRGKSKATIRQVVETGWDCSPRSIDIHGRGVASSIRTGRLTQISEEEHDAGGVARRRRSDQSKDSKGSSAKLDDVLLECLVP